MILQLNPQIPVTRKSDSRQGFAFLVIDYSQDHYILFAVAFNDTGEIWLIPNNELRMQENISLGRKL